MVTVFGTALVLAVLAVARRLRGVLAEHRRRWFTRALVSQSVGYARSRDARRHAQERITESPITRGRVFA